MTKQQKKFKTANSACRREVHVKGWPTKAEYKKFGRCMSRRLKRGR